MKKLFILLIAISFFLCLSGCSSSVVRPIKETSTPFDLTESQKLVKKYEQPILELSQRKTISRSDWNDLTKAYGFISKNLIGAFIDIEELNNPEIDAFQINQTFFFPLTFHQSVDITNATIRHMYYEDKTLNTTILTINLGYSGTDPMMLDFYRSYHYKQDESGTWKLISITGVTSYSGENFYRQYLKLK